MGQLLLPRGRLIFAVISQGTEGTKRSKTRPYQTRFLTYVAFESETMKGRKISPFQGWILLQPISPGVAPGYLLSPHRGENNEVLIPKQPLAHLRSGLPRWHADLLVLLATRGEPFHEVVSHRD